MEKEEAGTMEKEEAGMKTPDDECIAESVTASPKMPEFPTFLTDGHMNFEIDEDVLKEFWNFLVEDIVLPDAPPASEAVEIDSVGNAMESGTTSPETGTPSSMTADADMDHGISVSDLPEFTGEGTNMIPSAVDQASGTEMDHILPLADSAAAAAAAEVPRFGDDERRERVLGRGDLN